MSDKEFSLDDILSDLKEELKVNGINDITDEEIKKYSVEIRKYDTATLLDEVNATLTEQKDFTNEDNDNHSDENVNIKENEQSSSNDDYKIKQNTDKKIDDTKDNTETEDEVVANEKEKLIEKQQLLEEIKSVSSDEAKKRRKLEEKRLKELMLSDDHIKYISLRKNRERLVKEFVLNPQYTNTQPINVKVEEESNKSLKEQSIKDKKDIDDDKKVDTKNKSNVEDFKMKIDDIDESNEEIPDEYTKDEQTKVISNYLDSMQKSLKGRLIALGIVTVLTILFSTLTLGLGSIVSFFNKAENPLVFCITNLVLLLSIIGISYDTIIEGVYSIFQKTITRNTIFSISFIAIFAVNIAMLFTPSVVKNNSVNLYVPLASVCAFASMLGRFLDAKRRFFNFSILKNKDKRYNLTIMENQKMAEDFTKASLEDYPTLVYNKKTKFLSYFMEESFGCDESDRVAVRVLPIVLILSTITLIISLILKQDLFVALGAFNGILLSGTGVLPFLMVSLPLYDTAKKLVQNGGAVLSVESSEDYTDVNSITLDATQIFDGQAVTLYGIKTFSDTTIDKIILDATSVLCESNSILGNVFLNIINNREDYLEKCDNLIYEDGMGISAWIDNRRILIGSRELMKNHNIKVPPKDFENKFITKDKSLIYLSIAGQLSAVFRIGLECNHEIKKLVYSLYDNNIVSIIRTVDPIITRDTLAKVFGLPQNAFRVIPSRLHKELSEISQTEKPIQATVCNDGSLKGYIYSLLFAKKLPKVIQISLAINYVVMGLVILLFVAFTFLNGLNQLNSLVLCGYQLGLSIICYIIQKFYYRF